MKRLWYVVKGQRMDREGNLTEPELASYTLREALKDWQQNSSMRDASIEVRQDTASGYRIAGKLSIYL